MIPIDIRPEDHILIVAPHPDDECIGAGGVLVRYAAQTDVVLLTNGCACNSERPKAENVAIRQKEFAQEMALAGVYRHWSFNIDDGTLSAHTDCLCSFDLAPYDIVFVTTHLDNHPDHRAACMCVRRALSVQRLSPRVYEYEIAVPLLMATEYLDLTDVMAQKLSLIRCHQSQVTAFDYPRLAQSLASYRAVKTPSSRYVEAYARLKWDTLENSMEREFVLTKQVQRYQQLYQSALAWLQLAANHQSIEERLLARGCHTIAVYGYTPFAKCLIDMLSGSRVHVAYVIDRKGTDLKDIRTGITVVTPSQPLEPVNLVVVTVLHDEREIQATLAECRLPSVSLRDLLEDSGEADVSHGTGISGTGADGV